MTESGIKCSTMYREVRHTPFMEETRDQVPFETKCHQSLPTLVLKSDQSYKDVRIRCVGIEPPPVSTEGRRARPIQEEHPHPRPLVWTTGK